MSHPSLVCVKCKSHTDTLGRHPIQMLSNRRAIKGICPVCSTETYRFLPGDGGPVTQLALISSQRRLPRAKAANKSMLIANVSRDINEMSRLEIMNFGLADRLLHYGILFVIFGLSIVIGFIICSRLLP